MLIDLISAPSAEAEAILTTSGHEAVWPTLVAKTVDQIKLASLAFLLSGKDLSDVMVVEYSESFVPLATGGDDGPWVYLVPPDLVASLVDMQDDRIDHFAQAWALTEELQLDRWSVADASAFLRELKRFAIETCESKRELLLWVCL
jgi:hypothetical protein